jgi:hypothetical protein
MNINWLIVVSAALALILFFFTYHYLQKVSTKQKYAFTALSFVLALPAASFALYYTHFLADISWYFEFRSWLGTELLIVFLGVAGGSVASLMSRKLLVIPLAGTIVFSAVPLIKPVLGPPGGLKDNWKGSVCIQSSSSTCGPSSVATILKSLGVESREKELAYDAYSYAGGTEAWYLARAVRSKGFDAQFFFLDEFNPELAFPALVGVRFDRIGHFIPVLKCDGTRVTIGDPLVGLEEMSIRKFKEKYQFTGFYMTVGKAK